MANQTGIAITIRAFLPVGKTIDEQYAALTMVKDAHASGDYSAVLKAAQIDDVKSEQKTRRMPDAPAAPAEGGGQAGEPATEPQDGGQAASGTAEPAGGPADPEADIPDFLKGKKGKAE